MKVVVVATRNPDKRPEDFAPLLDVEAKTAMGLLVDDFIREIYSMASGKGAVMVCEAKDEAEARERLSALPFVQNDLLDLNIIPVVPYRGFVKAAGR